ncbi:hypothetical protein CBR_g82609 [Chara braunii]|uniref:DUF7803 domain-containing protein n=1 Tax=Chara braunii TaxID=69332 RepID=A0A388JLJ9_CHABU|nr:hypothetical protein CBR_g82609 [Chara braunii]|eukprot:GBG48995.1 hypothetical protein CBR_g82609 [Chara braunii]
MAEEAILTGDDLMTGAPSPLVPAELSPYVVEGLDTCTTEVRRLFQCLYKNDVEPFCQDELILVKRCTQERDELIRKRLMDGEKTLGSVMPLEKVKERDDALKAESELLERRLILASTIEGVEGFRVRWRLNGELLDVNSRLEALRKGAVGRKDG